MDALNFAIEHGIKINSDRSLLSISDDDYCANCKSLLYSPGDRSLCNCEDGPAEDWPCRFNNDGYSISCKEYHQLKPGQSNILEDLVEVN